MAAGIAKAILSATFGIFILLLLSSSTAAQIIIIPGTCPPGFTFVPPSDCVPNPTPSPTPSPSPVPTLQPIVLVPGITVSQNKKLLYKDDPSGDWKFAFGFNVYKGVIRKLESAGYTDGFNLRVAHYDWRNPATHNARLYLKPIIDEVKSDTGASTVNIVAHSFGGVVSRAYVQSETYEDDVDQLVTLGSPHQGSADAYVAREGGIFPEGWKFWIREKINRVERSLKETRDNSDIRRPESFRSFFPSLKDMLPLNNFVRRDSTVLPVTDLTEQNIFLKGLHETLADIATNGVEFATVAGASVATLHEVNITDDRTHEDEALNRWRDGRANPIPPPLDSIDGDARVLLSSALVGSETVTLNDAQHHRLPDAAQDEVFEILGLEEQPSFFSEIAESVFSKTILSPIAVTIHGPNGAVLSPTENTFGEDGAEYDDDPNDPDDPIEITLLNPPPGEYTITYTGTGEGDYTIITTYADEDEVTSATKKGTTFSGETFSETITITDDTTSIVDDEDYKSLLKEISRLARQAKKDRLIKGYERARISRPVTHALRDLRIYEARMRKDREKSALKRLRSYYQALDSIERTATRFARDDKLADLSESILKRLTKIRHHSPPL